MFGLKKRRKEKSHLQILEHVELMEVALLRRVLPMIEREQGKQNSELLSRSVVDLLLAKPCNGNGERHAVVIELAGAIAEVDKQIRDSLFVSLRAMLTIAGDTNNFAGERRILETMFWLKQFGEIPPHSDDSDVLICLARKLETAPLTPATLTSARN